jgi:hypothetical protein
MDELPSNPRNPYLGEVQKKQPLMTALQAAFDLFDVDASGTLTNSEVTNALKHLRLTPKNAEVKTFLRELDKNGDNEVDMREFLAGLNKRMAHKIADAMETNEDMIIALRAERQQKMAELNSPKASPRNAGGRKVSQQAVALGLVSVEELGGGGGGGDDGDENKVEVIDLEGTAEEDSAALLIQMKSRQRKAKQAVEHKRFLATAEGSEMNSAALMIQGRARQRKAKQEMARAAEAKRQIKLGEAALSEDLRSMVPQIMNETVFNLLREALETPVCDALVEKLQKQLDDNEYLLMGGGGEAKAAWDTAGGMATTTPTAMQETGAKKTKGKKGVEKEPEVEPLDEDEIADIEDKIEDLMNLPRFDLNLRPKTFVRAGE